MAVDREKVVEAALKFIEKKRYDKAIVEYQKILAEDPNDPRILQKIAEAQLKGKFVPEAIETYAKIGKVYAQRGFAQQAVSVYRQLRVIITEQAPQLEEKYAYVLPELARLHQQLGHVADTIRLWEEIAARHQRAGRGPETVAALQQLISLDGANPLYRLRLAEELAKVRDIEGAIEQFKLAADQLIVQGRSDAALKVFERLLQIRPDPDFARRTAELYLHRNQPNDAMLALAKLQIAFQANQKDLATLGLLALAFERLNQNSKAIDVYRETVRLAREQNNKAARKQALERVIALAPHDEQVQRLVRANPASSMPAPMPESAAPEAEVIVGETEEVFDENEIENLDEADDIQLDEEQLPPPPPAVRPAVPPRPMAAPLPAPRPPVASAPLPPPRPPAPSAPVVPRPPAPSAPVVPRPAPAAPPRPAAVAAPPRPAAPEPPVRPSAVLVHELDDLPDEPRSSGSVSVPPSMRAVEDFTQVGSSTDSDIDPESFVQETLADVASFRRARQPNRAIECLHIALEVVPGSVTLREQLRDVLLETGDREGAIAEMISIATLAIDQGDVEQASAVLHEVLLLSPEHRRASELLEELTYGGLEPVEEPDETTGADSGLAFDDEAQVADDGGLAFDDEAAEAGVSFDSEPRLAAASRRNPSSMPAPGLELTDDPFSEPAALRPSSRPPVRPASARPRPLSAPPRPRSAPPRPVAPPRPGTRPGLVEPPPPPLGLELDEPDLTPAAPVVVPPHAPLPGLRGPTPGLPSFSARAPSAPPPVAPSPTPPGTFDLDEPSFDDEASAGGPITERPGEGSAEFPLDQDPTAKPATMLTIARGFQGGDTLDDALEEVEFFASRGLVEDARAILLEQLSRFPNHPILLDKLRELGGDPAIDATPAALSMRSLPPPPPPPSLADDLLDASLDALDTFEPTQEARGHVQGQEEQVDVESVFAKFKEGVKAQVDDSDSATHYDLGFAYKQMGLLQDAISELELAARDPIRECVCWSMVGLIESERGRPEAAIEAFLRALQSAEKTSEQELSLFYELGLLYQDRGNKPLALDYFKRIQRRDPDFRDVNERIAALEPRRPAGSRSLDSEEDLDLVFDDILGSK